MAERRMFAKTIIDSDAFLDMPMSARLLYYDFSMRADDDGFVNAPKKITRITGASDDDIKVLIGKRFIIPFESGVVVIKHWRIHNYIRKDTYSETKYKAEKASLYLDENNAYSLHAPQLSQGRDEPVDEPSTQVRLGKDRLGKVSNSMRFAPPSIDDVQAYCKARNNKVDASQFVDFYSSKGWKVGNQPMKDWQAAVRTWEKREGKQVGKPAKRTHNHSTRNYTPEELSAIGRDLLEDA